jgi:hypothetical protein
MAEPLFFLFLFDRVKRARVDLASDYEYIHTAMAHEALVEHLNYP